MLAARLTAPNRLEIAQIDDPTPGPGGALIRVHAAAITRDELTWPLDRLPAIPSYEISGTVAALGPGANGLAVDDEVFALTPFDRDGGAAEYALVPSAVVASKPKTLDHIQSAAIPLAGLTAWQALFDHGGLQRGERVIVTGARGGVGHFAVQLARWAGAEVGDGGEPTSSSTPPAPQHSQGSGPAASSPSPRRHPASPTSSSSRTTTSSSSSHGSLTKTQSGRRSTPCSRSPMPGRRSTAWRSGASGARSCSASPAARRPRGTRGRASKRGMRSANGSAALSRGQKRRPARCDMGRRPDGS